ncbi:MAG: protein DpdD [Oxalobacteraceae bacterium]|nr:protein DpdD [Oxalobacteraceae bacterium]
MDTLDRRDSADTAQALQAAFFATPNHCTPLSIGHDEGPRRAYEASLRYHASGETDRAVLLPFRASSDGPTAWYACAASSQMALALQEEMYAFLGPSFVAARPLGQEHEEADQHALPLIKRAGWYVISFYTCDARTDEMVLRQWRLYDELLQRRPRVAAYVPSTFHQLRASFDRALLARNEPGALAAMATLRERFGISAENRRFLEIRLDAVFERWDAIVAHPLLPQLLHLQLPPETYGDVMEALYRVHVQPYEALTTLDPLLEQFKDTVAGPAQPLFRTRRTSRRPAVLKAFVLQELLQPEPQLAVCDRLLQELPVGAFGDIDRLIRETCAQQLQIDSIAPANEALGNEQFDRAWNMYWLLPDSVDVLRGLIACARESADPAKTDAVLTRLDAANELIRAAVESASATRLANLRVAYREPKLPERLSEQFDRLSDEPIERYVERWTEFARSVEPAQLLSETGMVDAAVGCLMRLVVDDSALFERLYPLWHELFIERIDPDRRLLPLYSEMLEALRARDVFQRTDQELLHQTLVAIVDSGDDAAYQNAVDTITKIFDVIRSPQAISWALDICDSLALRRIRDADARLRLLAAVVQACREFSARLDPLQIRQLQLLASEAQFELPPLGPVPGDATTVDLADELSYRVVFYSLNEGATRRAVDMLRTLHPGWVIDANADHVCSDRLKSLAQHAHVFVFAWRCSKHSAYYCVKANSPKDNLVMAPGVGTTSLVAAALDHLKFAAG